MAPAGRLCPLVHSRSDDDVVRSHRPGDYRRLPVPSELARHPDSAAYGPRGHRGHFRAVYLRDAGEAVDLVRRGEANITFLTNPVSMEQLREVAFAGDVMPQKSTDFFPKLLSGLTIYALD